MKRHKFALGLWEMMESAVYGQLASTHGMLPRRFEMHPANYSEFLMDERLRYAYFDIRKPKFMDVPIVVDVLAKRLRMITADNKVEYL